MPTWNLLADYYGKIPHNELVKIAKAQCTTSLNTEPGATVKLRKL